MSDARPSAPSLPLATLLAHAADAVAAVRAGRSLTDALAAVPAAARPGTQALAFQALRGLGLALGLREQLAPKAPPAWVDALLLTALALCPPAEPTVPADPELPAPGAAPYPAHTLVNQAVQAARKQAPAQAGFVNAVLRRYLREAPALQAAALRSPVAAWNHPAWWIDRLRADWPDHWAELLRANDRRAPMTLRVNRRQGTPEEYLARLAAAGLAARALPLGDTAGSVAIELDAPSPVQALPGFDAGDVSVQDAAAQRAAPLLLQAASLQPGARVLDACAAPGGKTAHLLELADLDLLALDADPARLVKVQQTLSRLRLVDSAAPADGLATAAPTLRRVQCLAADAGAPDTWWDGRPFDAILLDAPCTASGIVRRHPDVRWLRRPSDVAALAAVQARLLDALWPLLAPGGHLLYATCSVFKAEGSHQIDAFLQRTGDARLRPSPGHLLPLPDNPPQGEGVAAGRPDAVARQSVPDGFFYALLHKCSD